MHDMKSLRKTEATVRRALNYHVKEFDFILKAVEKTIKERVFSLGNP